jgi:predicted  nucleic acid-binding Zn-ribbon protein
VTTEPCNVVVVCQDIRCLTQYATGQDEFLAGHCRCPRCGTGKARLLAAQTEDKPAEDDEAG